MADTTENPILSEIPTVQPRNWKLISSVLVVILVTVVLGVVSAFLFWNQKYSWGNVKSSSKLTADLTKPPEPQKDEKTFRDKTEGVLEKNDVSSQYSQGTHKLTRPGGQSQTVYLVSSVVDLDQFLGQKVTVWGETFQSSQVGWLMDVGKVEKTQ